MKFAKRKIHAIVVKLEEVEIFRADPAPNWIYTAYAYNYGANQVLSIELVDTQTGEVQTQQINLPADKLYSVQVKEILDVESGVVQDLKEWHPAKS